MMEEDEEGPVGSRGRRLLLWLSSFRSAVAKVTCWTDGAYWCLGTRRGVLCGTAQSRDSVMVQRLDGKRYQTGI